MMMGEVAVVTDDRGRIPRRGFLGGGNGIGGSACLVCSYRKATRLVSSLNGAIRPAGLVLWLTLANLRGAMAAKLLSKNDTANRRRRAAVRDSADGANCCLVFNTHNQATGRQRSLDWVRYPGERVFVVVRSPRGVEVRLSGEVL